MPKPLPNRVAVYATALVGLLAALAPVIADMDWESTAGVIAGATVILGIAYKWLQGWQQYEPELTRGVADDEDIEIDPEVPLDESELAEDDFDEASAELPPAVVDAAGTEIDESEPIPEHLPEPPLPPEQTDLPPEPGPRRRRS